MDAARLWTYLALAGGGAFLLLAVAALIVFRQDLYEFSINPRSPFQVATPPPAPDYADAQSWAAWPADPQASAGADVFFLHTTTYNSARAWNAPIAGDARRRVQDFLIPGQAAVFDGIGDLYAPHYRQATLYAFFTRNLDSSRARMLAYTDVARAFEHFLNTRDPRQPFIIAGHGQGAVHATRVLAEYVAGNEELQQRFVAAYLAGATVPLDLFDGALAPLEPCRSPDQIRCVAAWATFTDGVSADEFFEHALYWDRDELLPSEHKSVLCTNPLSWSTRERVVSAAQNHGARILTRNRQNPLGNLIPNAVGAQCRNGILYTDTPPRGFRRSFIPGDRANHLADFNLFFLNIRKNVEDRLAAYRTQTGQASKNGELY